MSSKKNTNTNNIIGFYNQNDELCDVDDASYVKLELLGRAKKLESNYFIIDKIYLEKVIKHNWYLDSNGYPMTYTARSKTLHKNLLGKQQDGYVIDHINRNKLDNRLNNLRVITKKENSYNRTKNKSSKNKYKGVRKNKSTYNSTYNSTYTAYICKDGIKREISGCQTEEEAARIYDMMAEELFGEFAAKNFIL
jgi:hypothetical protein